MPNQSIFQESQMHLKSWVIQLILKALLDWTQEKELGIVHTENLAKPHSYIEWLQNCQAHFLNSQK